MRSIALSGLVLLIFACASEGFVGRYFSKESFEVDSSEHGTAAGKKSTSCKCGWANKQGVRVIAGKEAERHEFPFIVTLVRRFEKIPICDGTIITPFHVLTAAHCTEKPIEQKTELNIIYAEHNFREAVSKARSILVKKMIPHENYDSFFLENDITLLILARKLPFSDIVGPACMIPKSQPLDLLHKYVKLLGWGTTTYLGQASPVLKEVNLRVVDRETCSNLHPRFMFRTKGRNQLCTYGTKRGGCHGDSGGPVVWVDPETNRYSLVGIVSFGDVCGGEKPSVNVDVQSYADWIEKHIKENNPENNSVCTKQ